MEEQKNFKEFINNIKKVSTKKKFKISNSYGVFDANKYFMSIKPKEEDYIISRSLYYKIIRRINNLLIEDLLNGEVIKFPYRMGELEIVKTETFVNIKNNKIVTNLPINWNKTLELWYNDKEAKNSKIIIRDENKYIFKINYNKSTATFQNKSFYNFAINRFIKLKLKDKIQNNQLDAFLKKQY